MIILGAGPGGYVAAIRAGRLGLKTLLVEKHRIGGVCLNYGCIPTKILLGKTALAASLKKGKRFGLTADNLRLDYSRLSAYKDRVVKGLVKGVEVLLIDAGVETIADEGRFLNDRKLELSSGETVEFESALIATGSRNRNLPSIAVNDETILDSTSALALTEIPDSMLVIGAGAIGLELGLIFSRIGAQVTVVEMMSEILPEMDAELSGMLRNVLTKGGIKFYLNSTVESVNSKIDRGIEAKISGMEAPITVDKILLAVGRTPNTESLDNLSLEKAPGGYLKTDDEFNTSIPNIKAIGDVAGPPLLAHKASHQGIMAVEMIDGKSAEKFPPIPGAVFTEPEFASVGLTALKAEELGLEPIETLFPLQAVSRARTMDAAEGGFKIVSDSGGNILGVHILAPAAADIVAEASLAMHRGLKVKDLADIIHIHPTLSEGMGEAALLADGRRIHI